MIEYAHFNVASKVALEPRLLNNSIAKYVIEAMGIYRASTKLLIILHTSFDCTINTEQYNHLHREVSLEIGKNTIAH